MNAAGELRAFQNIEKIKNDISKSRVLPKVTKWCSRTVRVKHGGLRFLVL